MKPFLEGKHETPKRENMKPREGKHETLDVRVFPSVIVNYSAWG